MEKNYEKIQRVLPSGHGHYKITVSYRGRDISAVTNDMPTLDRYRDDAHGWKTAGNWLYKQVVRKNYPKL
jgi:hypothetical protein